MNEYGFNERLRMSDGVSATENIGEILSAAIPGAISVTRASKADDRSGVDWWVKRECERDLGVDVKVREEDFKKKKDEDDLALEVWSDKRVRIVGWTRDPNKKTDYILWFWKDTKRWALVPFPMLCAVFISNLEKWYGQYRHAPQYSREGGREWISECVFVPRREVWAAIYRRFGGLQTNTRGLPPNPGTQLDLRFGAGL